MRPQPIATAAVPTLLVEPSATAQTLPYAAFARGNKKRGCWQAQAKGMESFQITWLLILPGPYAARAVVRCPSGLRQRHVLTVRALMFGRAYTVAVFFRTKGPLIFYKSRCCTGDSTSPGRRVTGRRKRGGML